MISVQNLFITAGIVTTLLSSILVSQETDHGISPAEAEQGWIALFDGETLFGWKKTKEADWQVVDGEIRVSSGKVGLLRTTSQFDDFELKFEFRAPSSTNSGVFLRTSPKPGNVARDCYEFNIASADNPFPTGSLVKRMKSDSFWQAPHDEERWVSVAITAEGGSITAIIDDNEPILYEDPNPVGRGYIGLQHNKGKIAFRNIKLRPLNLTAMLDDQLSKWNDHLTQASKFSISTDEQVEGNRSSDSNDPNDPNDPDDPGDLILQVTGGSGQLETNDRYADFVFSTRCRTNKPGLNSGVFFRCIPGELMNGYESQIHNGFEADDPTRPTDCGTGGIFRRTKARRIVAADKEWFTKTIMATGPHVSVWVNGYQVTDWSDTRKPNENPRRGQRLEAGTIILQGHDPTTDINFANMRVRELSPRRPNSK